MPSTKSLADRATEAACKMLLNGLQGRARRFDDIRKNEDMYAGNTPPALRGRSNIPFDSVVMGGFHDTLLSETATDVRFHFGPTREQDKQAADKMTAVFERESAPDRGDWNGAIQDAKFLAGFSGRGFLKPTFESMPRFRADLEAVDHYDMVTEPMGGRKLDDHEYKFQMNIFRDERELRDASGNFYDRGQVQVLLARNLNPEYRKEISDDYAQKLARFTGFGIDPMLNNYVGQPLFNLTEGVIRFEGEWYYILFDPRLKAWVRFEPLTAVFEHAKFFRGRGPWATFATHRHPKIFWSKAPDDDVRPIAYTMKKVVNLTVDTFEKRAWDMRAYDPKIFREPTKLLYRQDGLVKATLKNGQSIGDGIYQFKTEDNTNITINLVQWLDNFLGQKSGITPATQGAAREDKVGILVSNMAQTSKRLQLENRNFREALVAIGTMFDYGAYEYIRQPYAVKLLGSKGARWEEEVTRRDTERDFAITVSDGADEDQHDATAIERKKAGFAEIDTRPDLVKKLNPNWELRERLSMMGYDDEQIRIALDAQNDADSDVLAKAAQAIADCLEGKELYELCRDATTGFVQKILDFCDENYPLLPPEARAKLIPSQRTKYEAAMLEHDKLLKYAMAHLPIAKKNAERRAVSVILERGVTGGGQPIVPTAPAVVMPNTAPSAPVA